MVITELALIESRSVRDQYANRTDVLDRVKALRMLPDDTHVTTEMVANYYEVPLEAIKSLVKDNRAELESNGYDVIVGDGLRSLKDLCALDSRARSLAVFTRRAVLNVGELLRDSRIARQVRTALLDSERRDWERDENERRPPETYPDALRALADEWEAHDATRRQLALTLPLAEAYADLMSKDGTFDWAATAQIFMPITGGLGRNRFLELLRDMRVLKANNTPYHAASTGKHFRVVGDPDSIAAVTTVKPSGLDWLRKRLIKHFNHQPALFDVPPPRLHAIKGGDF